MPRIQQHRLAAVSSPLGEDVLLFTKMQASEQMGRPFEYQLTLLSEEPGITFADIVGQSMTVRLTTPAGAERYFNGFVSRFVQKSSDAQSLTYNLSTYEATLVPWLWFLTRTADCRIFQEKKVPDIIKEVFREAGFTDFEDRLSGTYRTWVYCVQYRETDFQFVSRLMEQEGIYYYFKHQDGKHIAVLADSIGAHETYPGYAEIPYRDVDSITETEHVRHWKLEQTVRTGLYSLTDYDFEAPKKDLFSKALIKKDHSHAEYEVYDYPGDYTVTDDGDNYTKIRIEQMQAPQETVSAQSNAYGISTGYIFKLTDHERPDQCREYLIKSTEITVTVDTYGTIRGGGGDGPEFECKFRAMDSSQPFRMPQITPKAVARGPQTAVVVGPSGEEIWTDKYGRVKVQFHWDREGKSDENSSCWIRVAQVWAGKTWGGIHIPRIGQEVIVDFLEGDPDQPIITGRVYNADEMPPYALPANQTQSTIKSRSSKDGTNQNFNEIRFEDKKDKEEIYFHAEKDFNRVVENNDTLKVGFEKTDDGDQAIEIHNNQKLTVGNSKSKDGSQTIEIWKDLTETVKTGDETVKIEKGQRTVTIQKDDTLTVKQGNQSIKISMGKITTEAAQSIELKVGGSSIKIDPTSITLKAAMITIKGDASVDVKAPMTTVKGDATLILKGGMTMIN